VTDAVSTSSVFPKKGIRIATRAIGVAFALTLIAGLLHTPAGRSFLARLGIGCPVRKGTPDEVDRARAFGVRRLRGKPKAPARPALGFEFERTTSADVEAWAGRHRISCEKIGATDTLRSCKDVPAAAIDEPAWFGPVEEVSFEFRAAGTLASISTMRRQLAVDPAIVMTAEIGNRLASALGAPHVTGGENQAVHFAKGPLQAFKQEWSFGDYNMTLSEVRLADTGVMVREQYLSGVP
jgi:hypothetical protein